MAVIYLIKTPTLTQHQLCLVNEQLHNMTTPCLANNMGHLQEEMFY